jgi:hypothetical protein
MATACAAITQYVYSVSQSGESFDHYNRGWQQSTINASSLFLKWDVDFGLDDKLVIGFINAAPWLSGSLMYVFLNILLFIL